MTPHQAARLTAAQLAFVGDAAWEMAVRERLACRYAGPVGAMHRRAVGFVCAGAQARLLSAITDELTEEETDLIRRGRNVHAGPGPRGASPQEYAQATALETLIGYLHLSGQAARVEELADRAFDLADTRRPSP